MTQYGTKERAVARLDTFLREHEERSALDALDELREAVEHWRECDGLDHRCLLTTDKCKGQYLPCDHCTPGECEDCDAYKSGGTYTRNPVELLRLLEDALTSRVKARAS